MNNDFMNILVHVSWYKCAFLLGINLGVELLFHRVFMYSSLVDDTKFYLRLVVTIYISISSA